jgi:hypothetical protein
MRPKGHQIVADALLELIETTVPLSPAALTHR